MRAALERYVLDHMPEQQGLGDLYAPADQRRSDDAALDGPSNVRIVDYLDFLPAWDLLQRHRRLMPAELASELKAGNAVAAPLAGVRNRVMHGRPLRVGDDEKIASLVRLLASRHWPTTKAVLDRLAGDPLWEPAYSRQVKGERILHNLPLPETDETGLVGRHESAERLKALLFKQRERVLTVVGEGGIGKTALVVDVLYDLVDAENCPYDCVLYTSLKTERLTADGIQPLTDAAQGLTGIVQGLEDGLGDLSSGLDSLAEALEGIPTLVVIDNLETADADEILTLYDALPVNVWFLFTSRVGLGQIERRIPLTPLAPSDTAQLLRSYAKARSVTHLARAPQDRIVAVAERLRHSPLAVRWFVSAVARGDDADALLADQDSLLEFCLRSVHAGLALDTKQILEHLYCLDRPIGFVELAALSALSVDSVRTALLELQRGSLLEVTLADRDSGTSSYSVTAMAKTFLRRLAPPPTDVVAQAVARDAAMRSEEERRRRDLDERALAPNTVLIRAPQDRPLAYLLRLALAKRWDSQAASGYIDRARSIDASYFEIDRVEAFLSSLHGQVERANSLYYRALAAAPPENRPHVAYFFAGHLIRQAKDVDAALPFAREAHAALRIPETATQVAMCLIMLRQFDEGLELLRQTEATSSGRPRVIALTALVNGYHRQAEYLRDEHKSFAAGCRTAKEGVDAGAECIESGIVDERLNTATLQCLNDMTRLTVLVPAIDRDIAALVEAAERVAALPLIAQGPNGQAHFTALALKYAAAHIEGTSDEVSRLQRASETLERLNIRPTPINDELPYEYTDEILVGAVQSVQNSKYGFVAHPDFPNNLFFHVSEVDPSIPGTSLVAKTQVHFRAFLGPDGRPRAHILAAKPPPPSNPVPEGVEVELIVTDLRLTFAFCLTTDNERVFLHKTGLRDSSHWSRVGVGTHLRARVHLAAGERGPRAVDASATVMD